MQHVTREEPVIYVRSGSENKCRLFFSVRLISFCLSFRAWGLVIEEKKKMISVVIELPHQDGHIKWGSLRRTAPPSAGSGAWSSRGPWRRPPLSDVGRDVPTSESVGWQNFDKMLLVFGCIGSDFCKKICVLQHFSKSTRFSS